MPRPPRLLTFVACPNRLGGWARNFPPSSIRLRREPRQGEPSPTGVPFNRLRQPCRFMMKPIPPLPESGPSRVRGQGESEVFSPERPIELRIGWLGLFWLDLFGLCQGVISFMKSSLSSLFLLFLAGHFFSSLFAFISSSMFWHNTLLSPRRMYIMKKKRIPIKFKGGISNGR